MPYDQNSKITSKKTKYFYTKKTILYMDCDRERSVQGRKSKLAECQHHKTFRTFSRSSQSKQNDVR